MVTDPLQLAQGTSLPHDIHPGFPPNTVSPGQPGANASGLREISAQWVEIHKRLDHITQKKFTWEIGNRGNVETAPPILYIRPTLLFQLLLIFTLQTKV